MQSKNVKRLTGMALFTALIIGLQLLGSFIKFGAFSISLVLIPIVVGTALYGWIAGAWLGFVFGMVVLMSGDATLFLEFRPLATIFIVILKGILAGAVAGIGYKMFEAINTYFAVAIAATLCPLINTSVFLIGCYLFFMEIVSDIAATFGFEGSGYSYLILGLAGGNFLFELVLNITLCPVIVRIVLLGRKLN